MFNYYKSRMIQLESTSQEIIELEFCDNTKQKLESTSQKEESIYIYTLVLASK